MPTLDWIGKQAVVNHHQDVPYHLLRDVPELGCGPADSGQGGDRWSNDDSKEKRRLGELWAERSGGQGLFVMPNGTDRAAITAVMKGKTA